MQLAKVYAPENIEAKWYDLWEKSGYFKPTFKHGEPDYCIQLPPPNVTGTLHMGHGFQQTLMDILIRYHRMRGFNTLWQVGTDHAGIATQIVVERQLESEGTSKYELGRDEFTKRIWKWKEFSGSTITRQMRRLGASCDWSRERFTMDEGLSKAVTEVFVSLFERGYIYRGKRLVNWDVTLQTAVSDLEVVSEEEQGSLWLIRYPIKDSSNSNNESLIVATTRPETMFGDVAVAVNPEDKRYAHLVGKTLLLPLSNREIPIIADDYVETTFGTGCVKITPAHDFNDYEVGKRHNLESVIVFSLDGHINDNAPFIYRGMERFEARKKVILDLEEQGFLVEIKPHKLVVPRSERTGVVVEPMLTDQWFMNMADFAKKGLDLVASGKIKFVPDNWVTIYNHWLENIQDWCLSRQLWWGHRIPAYYDENGKVYVARNFEDAVKLAGSDKLYQDNDVLDTWFSSGLWCFSTLGWPEKTPELAKFLPSNVMITGFDIIFFWVARMIMFTSEFTNKVPFKDVYITGLIQDANGYKMSKSKGNVIDPIDLIDGINVEDLIAKRTQNLMNPKQVESIAKQTRKDYPNGFNAFGADALRFTFALLATHGREIRFDIRRVENSRNFCNKLWNASRFALMSIEKYNTLIGLEYEETFIDKWILSSLNSLIKDVDFAYETYRFDIAAQKLYEFVWSEFCDWYLELAKVNLQSDDIQYKISTLNTIVGVLEKILRLLHPVMPFITEDLWQTVKEFAKNTGAESIESIMIADYPREEQMVNNAKLDLSASITVLKDCIVGLRNLRATMNISMATLVPLVIEINDDSSELIYEFLPYMQSLAKLSEITVVNNFIDSDSAPILTIHGIRMMLKVEIDAKTEITRLNREIDKLTKEFDKIQIKFENVNFINRAPQELVKRDKMRLEEIETLIEQLHGQLNNYL